MKGARVLRSDGSCGDSVPFLPRVTLFLGTRDNHLRILFEQAVVRAVKFPFIETIRNWDHYFSTGKPHFDFPPDGYKKRRIRILRSI
jgi:hypothetical protein